MNTLQIDHVGVNVSDLDAATRFFTGLGFHCDGPWELAGEWLDRLVGLEGTTAHMATATSPAGGGGLEILAFHSPDPGAVAPALPPHAYGYRHVAFRVDDAAAYVQRARDAGYDAVGDIVDVAGALRVYVRGPEGLFVELIQPL